MKMRMCRRPFPSKQNRIIKEESRRNPVLKSVRPAFITKREGLTMRNSKKLIAVILTVVLLASMMVPALAVTYQAEADKLTNAGLMNGTPGTGLDTLSYTHLRAHE